MKKSGGRTTEQTKLLTGKEFNAAMEQGLTSMNSRFEVKTEKFCDEISNLRNRIVQYNANNGDEGLDDSDIEYLQDEIDDDNDSEVEFGLLLPQPQPVLKLETEDDESYEATNDTVVTNNEQPSTSQSSVLVARPNENIEHGEQVDDALVGALNYELNGANDLYFPEYNATIRSSIALVLRAWNSTAPFNLYLYDKKFMGVLVREMMLTQMHSAEEGMDEEGVSFIKHLFAIRVDGDATRLSKFDALLQEKLQNAKIIQRRE